MTTEKVIPAILKLVDIAGLVKGASSGEGLGNKFLTNIKDVDAILHVVRCFEDNDIVHVDGNVDPLRDIDTIDTELLISDLQIVEKAIPKAARASRMGDKEAKLRHELLVECLAVLEDSKPLRSMEIEDPEKQKLLKSFSLITAKDILYVANVHEEDLAGENEHVQKVRERAAAEGGDVVCVCASLEAELSELDGQDRDEMLEAVGLTEPALAVLARGIYKLLKFQSYFTAGEKEIRAWPVTVGATAPQAAGVIHSDFERGFIRAEVYNVQDLVDHKTEKAIRDAGKMRVEGKAYIMQDGDVVHFLFNV